MMGRFNLARQSEQRPRRHIQYRVGRTENAKDDAPRQKAWQTGDLGLEHGEHEDGTTVSCS